MTLPRGWHQGLTEREIRAVLRCEALADGGIMRIQPTTHEKGYLRVSLPRRHPYARSGTNLLHRYVFERKIGRRLRGDEHVHHAKGAAPTSCDLRKLELWQAEEHAKIGLRRRRRMARLSPLWLPRDHRGRFTDYPSGNSGILEPVPF